MYVCIRYIHTYSLLKFGYLFRITRPLSIFYIREDSSYVTVESRNYFRERVRARHARASVSFLGSMPASFFGLCESARKPMESLLQEISSEVIKCRTFRSDVETLMRKFSAKFSISARAKRSRSIYAIVRFIETSMPSR